MSDHVKKARHSNDSAPIDSSILPKLQNLSKEAIISCFAQAFNSSDKDTKDLLSKAVDDAVEKENARLMNSWEGSEDQSKILDFNWKEEKGGSRVMNIKDAVKDAAEYIELSGESLVCTIMMKDFVSNVKDGDELEFEDEEGEWGCEECGVPGSTLILWLEERRSDQSYRLVTKSDVMCACMSHTPESVCGGEEVYYPIT